MMVGADHDQLEKVRNQLMHLTKGWDAGQSRQLVRETVDEVVAPLVFAEALAIVDEHKREGRRVVIISVPCTKRTSPTISMRCCLPVTSLGAGEAAVGGVAVVTRRSG